MGDDANMGLEGKDAAEEKSQEGISRRNFLKGTAIGAAGVVAGFATAGILSGCAPKAQNQAAAPGKAGKPSFLTPPAPIPDSQIKQTVNTDVVVVGAGLSGLSAAAHAGQLGAKVVLLEKTASAQFRGMDFSAVGSKYQLGKADRIALQREFMRYGTYRNNQRVVSLWTDYSGKAADWLLEMAQACGQSYESVPLSDQIVPNSTIPYFPTQTYHLIPNATALAQIPQSQGIAPRIVATHYTLVTSAWKNGVDIRYGTPAAQLIRQDKGRVTGVIAKNADGSYTKFVAQKGVVLCAGDYGNDKEMLAYYIPSSSAMTVNIYNGTQNTGDGHKMGLWIGADIDEAPHAPMYFDIMRGQPPIAMANPLARQSWLHVNKNGERFANEDLPFGYLCNEQRMQPEHIKWVIWDAKWPTEAPNMHLTACKLFNKDNPLFDLKDVDDQVAKKLIITANTIDELAQKINVPVDPLKATIARYNDLARNGVDTDFGKRQECLTTIEKAPLYAYPMGIALLVTLGGLTVNEKLQVLDTEKNVIPGLYAAGNNSGSFYTTDYPITMPGNSHGRALAFGYLAGQFASELG